MLDASSVELDDEAPAQLDPRPPGGLQGFFNLIATATPFHLG